VRSKQASASPNAIRRYSRLESALVCPAGEEGAAYGAALHALWVWGHASGAGRPIADITRDFVAMDEATRVVPSPKASARYRDLQAIFDQTVRDLGPTFTLHRGFLRGQTPPGGTGA
jgi:sugar (pentulose or hexulose) kinase